MANVTWVIESKDTTSGSMVVNFTRQDGQSSSLNIPMPPKDQDVNDWVSGYAPVAPQPFADVEVGQIGSIEISESEALPVTEAPRVVGSWNEEYLRAMIYQVLEEIRESEA